MNFLVKLIFLVLVVSFVVGCAKHTADDVVAPSIPEGEELDTISLAIGDYNGSAFFEYNDQDTAFTHSYECDLVVLADTTVTLGLRIENRRVQVLPDLSLVPTIFTGELISGRLVLNDSIYFDRENNSPNYHNHFSFRGKRIN